MKNNFNGLDGMYGSLQLGALNELSRLLSKAGQRQNGRHGPSWRRVVLAVAVIATPLVLLAGRLGS